ncbi:MAG: tetratricopeptide repeat protein [Phycisphaerae bacterium]|nr:tetratricopeptide repeat protein [Phycisphaerae bacterium]
MKTGKWLLLTAAIAFVTGCAQQPKEFEPVRLEKAIDLSQTQYKQVDLTTATEVDLVEELHKVRADYRRLLEIMLQWYMDRGYYQKAQWAQRELEDLKDVRTYNYLTPIDVVQIPEQGATVAVAEAETLFEQAQKLRKEGEILPLVTNKDKLRDALDIYRRIVKDYPQSTVAPDAAYYAAEILKEHFQEDLQAIEYYKLALKLNPDIRRKVRFQMAVILDFRMHDRSEALKMYRRVLEEEADIDQTNTEFAARRISQLLEEQNAENGSAAAEPLTE